ncbi:MAG: UDP-glucose/GDP-mannose dehydrogenase family protein [Proteobacteria bacterium]|nr:UDP-glucose/GDP-mannose dehydrogenase family protein [Pseudomonadota bacterium]
MKIAVIGTGYVGLVTGVVLARLGHSVICVDNDADKLEKLRRGEPPIFEPGLEEMLKAALASGRLGISESVSAATRASEIVFIAVGTPPGPDGTPDVGAVRAAACEIAAGIENYTVVVNKSTVPIGTADLVERLILDSGVAREHFDVVSNPEFLREGVAIQDTLQPDRIVIGSRSERATNLLLKALDGIEADVVTTDPHSAELIKYAANGFLAMKVSYINNIARLCEACDADVAHVARGIGLDARIGTAFLGAGLGWGGSCLPKDVAGLVKTAEQMGEDFKLLKAAQLTDVEQVERFVERIDRRLGGLKGKTLAVLGLAFKPSTDDLREAKSLVIIGMALKRGAVIRAYDPVAMPGARKVFPQIVYAADPYDAVRDADALVLVTEWDEFKKLDLGRAAAAMRGRVVFDGRRALSAEAVRAAGLEYHTIGSRPLGHDARGDAPA